PGRSIDDDGASYGSRLLENPDVFATQIVGFIVDRHLAMPVHGVSRVRGQRRASVTSRGQQRGDDREQSPQRTGPASDTSLHGSSSSAGGTTNVTSTGARLATPLPSGCKRPANFCATPSFAATAVFTKLRHRPSRRRTP